MKTIFVIVRDENDGEGYLNVENVAAFSDLEVAKAQLISLRQHAGAHERYEIEEMALIEAEYQVVH